VLNAGQTQGDLPPGRDRGGAARVAEREERLRQVLQHPYELLLVPSRSLAAVGVTHYDDS
jgi:hypothetical protein